MKRPPRRVAILALAALAVVGLALMLRPRPVPVEVAAVTSGPLSVWIEDQGKTRLRNIYAISAPVAGETERERLQAGDPVSAGEVVAVLRPGASPFVDARTRQTLAADSAAAEAAVASAEAEVRQARTGLDAAQAAWARTAGLVEAGALSREQGEERRQALDAARASTAQAQAQLAARRYQLDAARSRLAPVEPTRGRAGVIALRSPVTGRVLRVQHQSAQVVPAGETILEVGGPADLEIVAELLSSDAVQVRPGLAALIEDWGGPPLKARVRTVNAAGFTKISALGVEEQRVAVFLDLLDPPSRWTRLGHDFRVTVRIVAWSAPRVNKIPVSALFRSGGAWAVYAIRGGRARLTRLAIGARNDAEAQVLAGLRPGDLIAAYPGDRLSDGVRVTRLKIRQGG